MMRPLDGITIISLEHTIAAPFCTRQLADLGVRVIKVERPGVGDFARAYDQRVDGMASHFVWVSRSKESLTLDLKQPEALAEWMSYPLYYAYAGATPPPPSCVNSGIARPALPSCRRQTLFN